VDDVEEEEGGLLQLARVGGGGGEVVGEEEAGYGLGWGFWEGAEDLVYEVEH